MANVLMLDRDLGFLWALSQELVKLGVTPIPSGSSLEAEAILGELNAQPAVLLVDCRLHDACEFAGRMRQRFGEIPVVAMVGVEAACTECAPLLTAILQHPEDRARERMAHCAQLIESLAGRSGGAGSAGQSIAGPK